MRHTSVSNQVTRIEFLLNQWSSVFTIWSPVTYNAIKLVRRNYGVPQDLNNGLRYQLSGLCLSRQVYQVE